MEPYLTLSQPKYAIHISRFRLSKHKLSLIVVCRFNGRPKFDFLSELCNLEDLGDGHHYLMKCDFL